MTTDTNEGETMNKFIQTTEYNRGYLTHAQCMAIANNKYKIVTLQKTNDRDLRPYRAVIAMDGPFKGSVMFGTPVLA